MSRRLIVDFNHKIRDWDGFGFNYVQTAQTRDIFNDPQEYGGFSLLSGADREIILDMVFGDDGLKPGVIKMFLDPFHQDEPGMSVAKVISNDGDLTLMGFGSNGTDNPNAFSIMNLAKGIQEVTIDIKGYGSNKFAAFCTSPIENYVDRGIHIIEDGKLKFNLSSRSVTTFFELSN